MNKVFKYTRRFLGHEVNVINLFKDQFAYGHREILLEYAGIEKSALLLGKLQHGIHPPSHPLNFKSPRENLLRSPFWVYSMDSEQRARENNYKHVKAIGAPWLYLKSMSRVASLPKSGVKFLIMPEHSTHNFLDISTDEDKRKRAAAFKKIVGDSPATVCLHYIDFLDPVTRSAFADFGWNVTCVGIANNPTPWSYAGNRTLFLSTLLSLMESHSHWVGEGFSSSMFYAANCGMKIGVFPEIRKLVRFGQSGVDSGKDETVKSHSIDMEFITSHFAKSINNFHFDESYSQTAGHLLGVDCLKSASELQEILLYKRGVVPGNYPRIGASTKVEM